MAMHWSGPAFRPIQPTRGERQEWFPPLFEERQGGAWMSAFVLSVCQRKGGVGRSTLLYSLAGALAKAGRRVLLVDLDPQASISQVLLTPEAVDTMPARQTVAAVLGDELFGPVRDLVVPTDLAGISLLPGGNAVAKYNFPEPEKAPEELQFALRDAFNELRPHYDSILVDTPPSLETLSWVPLVAADIAITPSPAEPLAVQELAHASRFLERVRWKHNPRLVWAGVVLTMMSKAAIHATFEKALRDGYGNLIMDAMIPYNVAYKECTLVRQPLSHWKPKGAPAKAVEAVAAEILERAARLKVGGEGVAA